MGAFEWISALVEWFGKLFPHYVILDTTMGAVKFVGGKKAVALGPGVHWYWPFRTVLKEVPTARQADDLRTQIIVTKDGKAIAVGGMVITEVFDMLKLVAVTYDGPMTIRDITLTAIHDVCCELNWSDLHAMQQSGTLNTKMKNVTKRALEDYGVRPLKVMLTDLCPVRVYKLFQSTTTDN